MARVVAKAPAKNKSFAGSLPFTAANFRILGLGLVVIALGYVALAQSPWDGTMPLVVAPILLVIGYCIIIPIGILYRAKERTDSAQH